MTTQNHTEMLRLIQQYLHDHGFSSVAQDLEAKSGVHMEDRTMLDFRECIANGLYNEAREILKARVASPILEIEYLLYEQEYLELVEQGENLKAVLLMQRELTPRCPQSHRLVELSKLNLCRTPEALHKEAKWAGSGAQGRQELVSKLQSIMPVTEMLPPRRLEHLVNQSILYQTSAANCTFHNPALMGSFSLLEDHNCSKRVSMPTKCIGVLKKHADEVWLIKFAPSGQRFASIGKDNIILLWSLRRQESHKGSHSNKHPVKVKYSVKCTHEIIGHSK